MKTNLTAVYAMLIASACTFSNCQKEKIVQEESLVGAEKSTSRTLANTIWVASSGGSDAASSPGTETQPLATIQAAVNRAVPGTTILLKDGFYRLTSPVEFPNSGLEGNRIYLRAQNKYQAIISGANTSGTPVVPADVNGARARKGLINILSKSWITLDGLLIQKSQRFGVFIANTEGSTVKSNKIDVINCLVEDTYASGIMTTQSSNINVKWNIVQRVCLDPNTSARLNECISMASVSTFEVAGNTVKDRIFPGTEPTPRGGEGIDAKNACTNGKIYNNLVYNLDKVGIYVDAYAETIDGIQVYNNTVYSCVGGISTAVEGTREVGGSGNVQVGILKNVRIFNNLIRSMSSPGIRLAGYLEDGPQQNIFVYQNTVSKCLAGILLEANDPLNSNIVIKNNIFANNTSIQMKKTAASFTYTVQNNLIVGSNTGTGAVTGSGAITAADAGFVSLSGNNFDLLSSSPAKDKAQEANFISTTDITGATRTGIADLGAYEN